jgi:hypothetical protein
VGVRRPPDDGCTSFMFQDLCRRAGYPEMFDDELIKTKASKLIGQMREKAGVE